jgi:hypothetical protein
MPIMIPPESLEIIGGGDTGGIATTSARLYVYGSGLEVPGLESVIEYGDSGSVLRGEIPGALKINDKEDLTRVRLNQIDGLHDDPDGRDSRSPSAGRHGERAGQMVYGGRTVGLTGKVEAGNIPAMRDLWRRMRSTFNLGERDLVLHVPNEIVGWTNSLYNPSLDLDASYWAVTSTATTSGFTGAFATGVAFVGQVGVTAAGASVTNVISQESTPWSGEDVYISARVKVIISSGAVSSIRAGVSLSDGTTSYVSQDTPASNTWYWLSIRLAASDLWSAPTKLGFLVQAETTAAAAFQLQWDECMLVLLDPDEDAPGGYFDGDDQGFEWSGVPGRSRSTGPHYAVNLISDPTFSDVDSSFHLQSWTTSASAGSTATMPPTKSLQHVGEVGASVTARFVKDATSTYHDFNIYAFDSKNFGGTSRVREGRTYRLSATVYKDLAQTPPTGDICVRLFWVNVAGALFAESRGAPMVDAVERLSLTVVAPEGAVLAWANISLAGVVTPSATWHVWATDPCFIDISDYDPGDFYGVAGEFLESTAVIDSAVRELARRRIPRPFVLHKVRKTSDAKAPERQVSLRATRDFTMSLRAADPRIYVLGDRTSALRMTGVPETVAISSPSGFTLDSGSLPVPTGFTYEGHYITHPGTGTLYSWSQRASNNTTPVTNNPNGGVEFRAYGSGGGSAAFGTNRPAQDIRTRMYRSAEGYTYANPRVVLGGTPGSAFGARSTDAHSMSRADISLGGGVTESTTDLDFSALTLLLKRVAAGTWLELRWNSWTYANLLANGYGANPQAVYAFELWCSHNAAGTSGATRLAGWDYQSYDSSSVLYPFSRLTDPMWLVSWLQGNVVHWELWSNYPAAVGTVGRLESQTYSLPAPLQTLIGSTVEARPGWSIDIENATSDLQFEVLAFTPPYIHYYEQSDVDVPAKSITVPVMGDIDTPQTIELRGGIVDPIVSVTVPAFEDHPAKTTTAIFQGTISDANPITVNLANGTVQDSFGQNQYGMMKAGSSFATLRPGNNTITLRAGNWGAYPAHLLVGWQDALI